MLAYGACMMIKSAMQHVPSSHFDPALTARLTQAFDRAWEMVETSVGVSGLNGRAASLREAIALRIVERANAGMTNVNDLAIDALSHVTDSQLPEARETLPTYG